MGNICCDNSSNGEKNGGLIEISSNQYQTLKNSRTDKKQTEKKFLTLAKICRIIDGDTVEANAFVRKDDMETITIRLYGIDSPESRTKNLEEKKHGLCCKAVLQTLIENSIVLVQLSTKRDKFGRYLGTLYSAVNIGNSVETTTKFDVFPQKDTKNLVDINRWLLHHTSCYEYFGKQKKVFDVLDINQLELCDLYLNILKTIIL